MKYLEKITKGLKITGAPVVGEAFEGHPDDPTVLEEYYLADNPSPEERALISELLNLFVEEHFEIDSNVITIYK